ncbi:MAG: hypothetical protein KDC53_07370, partial [Saprospiraceae bacterium]|nr:hypothetical protein [Saprospiraceae bacterium]
ADDQLETILAYSPVAQAVKIRNPQRFRYQISWFDPVNNKIIKGGETTVDTQSLLPPSDEDYILSLEKKK